MRGSNISQIVHGTILFGFMVKLNLAKELIYKFNSDSEVETLIDRLEEQIDIRRASLDEELGYSLRNEDRSLEIRILPKQEAESFDIIVKAQNERVENLSRQIFGTPKKESYKDASIMDIAEFIADLSKEYTQEEICSLLKEKFNFDDKKLNFFTKMIIKQAKKADARDYLRKAAIKLQQK